MGAEVNIWKVISFRNSYGFLRWLAYRRTGGRHYGFIYLTPLNQILAQVGRVG